LASASSKDQTPGTSLNALLEMYVATHPLLLAAKTENAVNLSVRQMSSTCKGLSIKEKEVLGHMDSTQGCSLTHCPRHVYSADKDILS
jgi:hypothetical protein